MSGRGNPDNVHDALLKIANDGARPHIKAGIVARLRDLRDSIQQSSGSRRDGWLERLDREIEALEQLP